MNTRWKAVAAAAAGVLLVAGPVTAQDTKGEDRVEGRVVRAKKLLDAHVKNMKGEKIGEIDDLIFDKSEGKIGYAILEFGGFLGMGEKLFAIPFVNVVRTNDEDTVMLDISKEMLEKAPNFKNDTWPDFTREYGTTINDYYKAKPYWSDAPTQIDKDALDKDRLRAHGMCRVSKFIGTDVEDATGKNLGDVDDVVIDDATGRAVYVVLSFGGFLGMGDKLFAIPTHSLTPSAKNNDKLILDVPKEKLEKAPGFDKKNWPNMADRRWATDIHNYYGQTPYWDHPERH